MITTNKNKNLQCLQRNEIVNSQKNFNEKLFEFQQKNTPTKKKLGNKLAST